MSGLIQEAAFPRNAHSRERVVPSYHPASKMRRSQILDGWCRTRLQSVFENDKAQKLESRLCLVSKKDT
jgi:hypothetical protein